MSAVRLLESIVRDMKKQLADHTAEHEAVCEQLRLANIDQANTEAKLNDAKRDLATVQGERERYKWLVQQLYTDLPAKRDWLDPAIERELAALAQPAAQEVKDVRG